MRIEAAATHGMTPTRLRKPDPPLSDGTVVLRPWGLRDARAMTEGCRDDAVARYTRIPSPYRLRDARAFVVETKRGWRNGSAAHFAITEAAEKQAVGSMGIAVNWRESTGEVGYWLAQHARGRGLVTRALRLVSRWALLDLALARLSLYTDVENSPSQRVAEGAGFSREGVMRSLLELGGKRRTASPTPCSARSCHVSTTGVPVVESAQAAR